MQQISDHVRQQYMSMNVPRAALHLQQFSHPTPRQHVSPAAAQACACAAMPERLGMLPSGAQISLLYPEASQGLSRHSTVSPLHPFTQQLQAATQLNPHATPQHLSPQYPAAAQTQLNAASMPSSSIAIGPSSLSTDAQQPPHRGPQWQSHQTQTGRIPHNSPVVNPAHHESPAGMHSYGPASSISMQCQPQQQAASAAAQLPHAHSPAPASLFCPSQPASPQHYPLHQLHQPATQPDETHSIADRMIMRQPHVPQKSVLQPIHTGQLEVPNARSQTVPLSQGLPSDRLGAQQPQQNTTLAHSITQTPLSGSNALLQRPNHCGTSNGQGFSTLLQAVEQGDAANQRSTRVSAAQQADYERPLHSSDTVGASAAFAHGVPASAANPVISASWVAPSLSRAAAEDHASPDHHAAQRQGQGRPTALTSAAIVSTSPVQTKHCPASSGVQQLEAAVTSSTPEALFAASSNLAASGKLAASGNLAASGQLATGQPKALGAAVKPALPTALTDMPEASPVLAVSDGSFRFAQMSSEGGRQSGTWNTPVLQAKTNDTSISSGECKILTCTQWECHDHAVVCASKCW